MQEYRSTEMYIQRNTEAQKYRKLDNGADLGQPLSFSSTLRFAWGRQNA